MTVTLQTQRRAAIAAVTAAAAVLVAILLVGRGSGYELHAHFASAGRLVPGGEVQVAGRKVGSISDIGLTPDGQADVTLKIDRGVDLPLRQGTRAEIRAFSQGSVSGNVVVLTPGPEDGSKLSSGGVLPRGQTTSLVDVDALLDTFGPRSRKDLAGLIDNIASVYAGSSSRYFNDMLGELDPALAAIQGTTHTLSLDRGTISELVRSGSAAARTVASRNQDLADAVTHTAGGFGAIARQRRDLADLLQRLPPVLSQARGTLRRASNTLTAIRPTLRQVVPVAKPVRHLLAALEETLPRTGATARELRSQLPDLNRALNGLPGLKRPTLRALTTLAPALRQIRPIAQGLRYYGTDVVIGSLAGLFGNIAREYDGYGHLAKVNFVESLQTFLQGPAAAQLSQNPVIPDVIHVRTGMTRRCPGGNEPPAPDGSSPWDVGASLCTPGHDVPESVNNP